MAAPLLAAILLAAFAGLDALAGRLKGRWRAAPLSLLALALFLAGTEYARFDHGHPDWLLWIGFVGAPVVVIFGGAAWGVRRWYGWPDWGPLPGRLAAVAAALLVGILAGSAAKEGDVAETMRRGEGIAAKVRAWRMAHGGRGPATLEEAVGEDVPRTAMGLAAPPPFAYDPAKPALSFPVRTGTDLVLDLSVPAEAATWRRR